MTFVLWDVVLMASYSLRISGEAKKTIHMGEATHLLFDIKGKRRENYHREFDYKKHITSY